ncbi:hypothetical protein MKZ38_002045 [Zalerion maritima]|uniref:Uncharacterized protein n=1 Tax=Zalerion maritima TaxID=339359 RepID=A0AAD5RXA9_9PEZI|nr:hypothetical protein MKZ38_002045 [Zalerion maritima]
MVSPTYFRGLSAILALTSFTPSVLSCPIITTAPPLPTASLPIKTFTNTANLTFTTNLPGPITSIIFPTTNTVHTASPNIKPVPLIPDSDAGEDCTTTVDDKNYSCVGMTSIVYTSVVNCTAEIDCGVCADLAVTRPYLACPAVEPITTVTADEPLTWWETVCMGHMEAETLPSHRVTSPVLELGPGVVTARAVKTTIIRGYGDAQPTGTVNWSGGFGQFDSSSSSSPTPEYPPPPPGLDILQME